MKTSHCLCKSLCICVSCARACKGGVGVCENSEQKRVVLLPFITCVRVCALVMRSLGYASGRSVNSCDRRCSISLSMRSLDLLSLVSTTSLNSDTDFPSNSKLRMRAVSLSADCDSLYSCSITYDLVLWAEATKLCSLRCNPLDIDRLILGCDISLLQSTYACLGMPPVLVLATSYTLI